MFDVICKGAKENYRIYTYEVMYTFKGYGYILGGKERMEENNALLNL